VGEHELGARTPAQTHRHRRAVAGSGWRCRTTTASTTPRRPTLRSGIYNEHRAGRVRAFFGTGRRCASSKPSPIPGGAKMTTVEEQSSGYAAARLKWIENSKSFKFIYEAICVLTRFTDARDPKPGSREVFSFHRPDTLCEPGQRSRNPFAPPCRTCLRSTRDRSA